MLSIGLTGGIGSGKSTVADYFRKLGAPVYDTDEIARDLVMPGQPALQEITDFFGMSVLDTQGTLDRKKLRGIVFNNKDAKAKLESILHPRIREALFNRIQQTEYPYCIAVIPLLIEKKWQTLLDRILVVDCDETLQKQRASRRDNMTTTEIEAVMRSQIDRNTRLQHASDIVHNDGDLDSLQKQVEKLHKKYLTLKNA